MITEKLLTDSISKLIKHTTDAPTSSHFWKWIAFIEFAIIVLLIIYYFTKKTHNQEVNHNFKEDAMKGDIDFGNIINSSFNVQPLYDELKVKCHPDRFPTDGKMNKIADALFQEITKNKTNYKKLLELKEQARQELNINL